MNNQKQYEQQGTGSTAIANNMNDNGETNRNSVNGNQKQNEQRSIVKNSKK